MNGENQIRLKYSQCDESFGHLVVNLWLSGSMSVEEIASELGISMQSLKFWVKQLRPFGKLRLEIIRRSDSTTGFEVLPKRWIVERTFGWLCKSRRLCRDYEVRLDHGEAMIRICMIRLMPRRLAAHEGIFKTRPDRLLD